MLVGETCHLWCYLIVVRSVQIWRSGLLWLAEHQRQRTRWERGWRCRLGTRKRVAHRPTAGGGAQQPAQQRRYAHINTNSNTMIEAQQYHLLLNNNSWDMVNEILQSVGNRILGTFLILVQPDSTVFVFTVCIWLCKVFWCQRVEPRPPGETLWFMGTKAAELRLL